MRNMLNMQYAIYARPPRFADRDAHCHADTAVRFLLLNTHLINAYLSIERDRKLGPFVLIRRFSIFFNKSVIFLNKQRLRIAHVYHINCLPNRLLEL